MRASKRIAGLGMLVGVPAMLLLHPASAQQQPSSTSTQSVVVSGKREAGNDPTEFVAANNKVLSRKRASSCNFMSAYNANDDDVVLAYMKDFGLGENEGNVTDASGTATERIRESSPFGDAQSAANADARSPLGNTEMQTDNTSAAAVGCSNADRAFAAGLNRIMRNDKTLAEGYAAYDRGDYKEALVQFQKNYDKLGYDTSALMIGKIYLNGKGVPADTAQAVTWLRRAVEQRFDPADRLKFDPKDPALMNDRVEAAMLLAKIYLVGYGVQKDPRQARKWYEAASDSGYAPATSMLGMGYLNGFAGERNPSKGAKLLKEAAEVGYVPAMYQLGRVYYGGEDGVAKDVNLAGAYFAAAAKEGHAGAQFAAGRMYDLGESVAPDPKRALAYYKEAAVKGVPDAQNALATFFYQGQAVEKNAETARKLFQAAANQGQSDAMFNLAVMMLSGEGGPKDLSAAYVWLNLAKSSGHPNAVAALKQVSPMLSKDDLAKAESILKPPARSAQVK